MNRWKSCDVSGHDSDNYICGLCACGVYDEAVAALRADLAKCKEDSLETLISFDCTWGIGSGRHCPVDNPCMSHRFEACRSRLTEAEGLLRNAREFIVNGVEFGYIRMPDEDTPDMARMMLPSIDSFFANHATPGPSVVGEGGKGVGE